jgi:hypothetical protein
LLLPVAVRVISAFFAISGIVNGLIP